MKNLSSLAPFSLLGSLGMLYTAAAMMIRFFGKAYAPTGKFGMDMAASLRPKFGDVGASGILSPSAAILVGMLSTAYMAHFNAPKVRYARSMNNLSLFHLVPALYLTQSFLRLSNCSFTPS
jgi:hypothetical protein